MRPVLLARLIPFVLLALWLGESSRIAPGNQTQKIDLTGVWKVSGGQDDGLEVCIKQSGQGVSAKFIYGAKCPHGDDRNSYFTATLGDASLRDGQLSRCTHNQQLLIDCHLFDPYSVKFEGGVTTDTISVTAHPDYINYDEKDGRYTNCRTTPGGANPDNFSLKREPCNQQTACSWQFTKDALDQAIRKAFQDQGLKLPTWYNSVVKDLIRQSTNANGLGFGIPMEENGMPIVLAGWAEVTPCGDSGVGGIKVGFQVRNHNPNGSAGGYILGEASGSGDFSQNGLNQGLGAALKKLNLKQFKSGT